MNGNESVMKRKPQTEELEDGEREKRRKRVEGIPPTPIEFPMNQSMEIAVPENPLTPLLDRSGGLAKYVKCVLFRMCHDCVSGRNAFVLFWN